MKKCPIRLIACLLVLVTLVGLTACSKDIPPQSDATDTEEQTTVEAPTEADTMPPADPSTDGSFRVILASDLHYTTIETYYTWSPDKRMQHFVDTLLLEHKANPIDLLIFVGDLSLDHLFKKGTWTTDRVSTTKIFMEKYATQIKEAGIPFVTLPGNHEQFNDEQWEEFTGNKRNMTVEVEGVLFIMPDSYGSNLEPYYDFEPTYTPMNVDYIKEQLALHPHCSKAFIVTHGFWPSKETAEFEELMRTEPRLVGIFNGDSHSNTVIDLGEKYGHKMQAQTGHFSQIGGETDLAVLTQNFWGFRELIVTPEMAISRYITVETKIVVAGQTFIDLKRTTSNSVRFY